MRVLLLSAYTAVSHRHWAQGLMERIRDVEWTLLELPPRHFRWRIRGNPLTWCLKEHETLSSRYDVVLATSTVDLATLVGLYPQLGAARRIVYFHENQFAYPESEDQHPQGEARMVNLYSALAADRVVFNSAFNRDSFIDGARDFLKRMPENLPAAAPLERLRERAQVLPVPIDPMVEPASTASRGHLLVWNHRWEYDKNPDDFFSVLFDLAERGVAFELAVMGQRFRRYPAIFDTARQRLADRLVAWGPQSRDAYRALLDRAAIVVSTTWHEFQGVALMEAAQRGALPLVPDRLCFPELYPEACRYDGTREGLARRLEEWLLDPSTRPTVPATRGWEWGALEAAYRDMLGLRGQSL